MTGAVRIEGSIVLRVARVLDIDAAFAREHLAVSRIPRRQDTIEQIDPSRHHLDEVFRRASAHQIPRLIDGQPGGGRGANLVHH
jgi:hypothetical protein